MNYCSYYKVFIFKTSAFKSLYVPLFLIFVLFSCKTDNSELKDSTKQEFIEKKTNESLTDSLDMDLPVQKNLKLDNGIEIEWIEQSKGERIHAQEVVLIDYKVRLADSTIIDGNHLLDKPFLPYIVGFGFQPKGWDLAFEHLRVGDFVKITLPAKFARGEKGVKGLIPDNADNFISMRILKKMNPTRQIDGVKIWLLEENKKNTRTFSQDNTIVFHTSISSPSSPFYYNSYAKREPFELKMDDRGVVPGLKLALLKAKKGDRMFVVVPAELAYGTKGYLQFVKPNEDIFFNLFVMDVLDSKAQ